MTIREIENAFKDREILNPDFETVTDTGYRAIVEKIIEEVNKGEN